MVRDHFEFRKKNQLSKSDKSLKQSWDSKIIELCEKINRLDNCYTTSSCSGRIMLIVDCSEKRDDLFVNVWHETVSIEQLNKALSNIKSEELIYFKQEPCILHIACKNLEDAQKIHDIAKISGWKRCGIISSNKRFVVEINATGRLEFPIFDRGSLLVDDSFLELVLSESNKKLKSSWGCIEKMEKNLG